MRATVKTTVILTGMIVILSLTLPAVAAGGVGGGERPEDPAPTSPEQALQEALAFVAKLGLVDAFPIPVPVPEPHAPGAPVPPAPPVPDVPPAPEPGTGDDQDDQEDEGGEDDGGGGMAPYDPTRFIPCDAPGPERDRCGEDPTPEEDPQAPQPGTPTPAQPPEAPHAPTLEETKEAAEDLAGPLPHEDTEPQSLIAAIFAPVQAAAASATESARVVITGVVTTAGFVADEATEQVDDHAGQAIMLVTGAIGLVNDAACSVAELCPDPASGADGPEAALTTNGAETGAVERPVGYVTLGLIAVGSLGLIALAFAGTRKLLGLGGLALLSRIPSKDIMKNDTRAQIFEIVQNDPGVSLNEIVDRLGLSRNAVAYHLAVFESEKQVVSVKDGKYRRYFINGGKYVNGAKDVVSTIKNDVTRNVIRFILDHPGAMQKEVCTAVGTSPSATNWHINRLEKVGLVEKAKVANTVRYSPGPSLEKYDLGEFGLTAAPVA